MILGLAGFRPETYDHEAAETALATIRETGVVQPDGLGPLAFVPKDDLVFDYGPNLPGHANGMILKATDAQGDVILEETYYSVGGGFVLTAAELAAGRDTDDGAPVPYPFKSATQMLEMCVTTGKSIAELKRANELQPHRRGHARQGHGPDLAGDARLHGPRACRPRASCPAGWGSSGARRISARRWRPSTA